MAKLDFVQTFIHVVRCGSFSAAARQLGMPRSTVSLHISTLEASLGVRLLKRSTRTTSLTEEGRQLFDDTSQALEGVSDALSKVGQLSGNLSGPIHLTAPADFPTEHLALAVSTFTKLHPEVCFKITLTNATLDLVRDNVDIAVRIAGAGGMDAVQRRLLDFKWQFCASAVWIERNGVPKKLGQVTEFISPNARLRTYLESTVLNHTTLPPAAIEVDNNNLVKHLILNNFGVGILPQGICDQEIANGRVVTFLDEAITAPTRLSLTFPTRADMVPRVRAFADHVCTAFGLPKTPG